MSGTGPGCLRACPDFTSAGLAPAVPRSAGTTSPPRSADRTVVLDHGHLADEGDHHRLIHQNGAYVTLWNAQATHCTTT
ncbi:ABC transporter ATP-binding protein/permease [Streptomyces clavuligerus]|uniref:ABC transporters: Transmembrane and ATP-binding protein n=1 Tax=Streptomyces clavuligerus TaxID=1901 RepID=B5GLW0_STRCL|nr:ABC transporter ATP-binding protein/permease [Streptomyces clavuligerus]EDY47306.1 hypothetical protein SSCG_00334 [Streptomyces clavuligerus]EFG04968.1 ABC transporters: Transmembrane and ATP-binding protein [Streptomyces clavuligerus]QCS10788.1 ABC transporter ATP-binding protein [Streptomyces clavuligerus]QPJ97177.1 ABC transporter ATP-binding protein [Streptomyces clavuligerus]